MTNEIGSEFHAVPFEYGHGLTFPRPGSLTFSGRTAIEAVLSKLSGVHSALLPSYCCDSMIMPFQNAGLDVSFFNVKWDEELKIELRDTADILLWCNYFGFRNEMPDFEGIIIEDITHSLLSEKQCHSRSDYLVASIRKWEPVYCGGYCSVEVNATVPSIKFESLKSAAMHLKTEYLFDLDKEKKSKFVSLFSESNRWLTEHYSGLSIDPWSREFLSHVDMEKQREKRRENARVIYEGLKGKTQFMFPIQDMDCPLFVPILINNREKIRKHLIKNEIYCPVHWPNPRDYKSNIYDMELSLICDQRYGPEDMERIVSVLSEVI